MRLIDIATKNCRIISIVGMAKNAGKTVTLNYLIQEAVDEGVILGITSTGRDGENQDIVTNTEKPLIYVPDNTIIATASRCLDMGDAKIEIMRVTNYNTPLGPVVLGRVRDGGYIQIAGPQTVGEIKKVCFEMLELGAQLVIVDGAVDRISSASPSISDGTIIATGAVISRDMNKVIEETIHTIELFRLPEVRGNKERTVIEDIIKNDRTAIIDNGYNVKYLDIRTALNSGGVIGSNIKDDTLYVIFSGALVKKTLEDIIKTSKMYKNVKFVVRDGTRIFIDSLSWQYFKKIGVNIEVLETIKVLAVTVNPYAPQGYYFEPRDFLAKVKEYIKDIPVFDVILGGE